MKKTEIIARIAMIEKLIANAEDIVKCRVEASDTAYREALGTVSFYEPELKSLKKKLENGEA